MRLSDDFRILYYPIFSTLGYRVSYFDSRKRFLRRLVQCTISCFLLFHTHTHTHIQPKKPPKDILYVNSLLFTERNLTVMINQVKPPCSKIGSNGMHFPVVKSFLLQAVKEMCFLNVFSCFDLCPAFIPRPSKCGRSTQLSKYMLCWQSH